MGKRKSHKFTPLDTEEFRRSMAEVLLRLDEKERLPCGCIVYKHSGRVVAMCYEHSNMRIGASV